MTIYFIRHLPTNWNKKGVLQGHNDISISDLSFDDIELIKSNLKTLSTISFDLILISGFKRTKETAFKYNINDFKIEPLLNELNFGKYEGKPKKEMIKDVGTNWYNNANEVILGEPLKLFEKRLKEFLNNYSNYTSLLIFGHGAVCRALIALSKYGDIDLMNKIEVQNNKLVKIKFN